MVKRCMLCPYTFANRNRLNSVSQLHRTCAMAKWAATALLLVMLATCVLNAYVMAATAETCPKRAPYAPGQICSKTCQCDPSYMLCCVNSKFHQFTAGHVSARAGTC
jgi:hypothetical protein